MDTKKTKFLLPTLITLALGLTGCQTNTENHKIIYTTNAPAPIGPYNEAIMSKDLLFLSGQIAIDPNTDKLVKGSISTKTDRVMKNLQNVLAAAGMDFSNVVKTTIYLTNMQDFKMINDAYGKYFQTGQAPARVTVQVAALPANAELEISMIAAK